MGLACASVVLVPVALLISLANAATTDLAQSGPACAYEFDFAEQVLQRLHLFDSELLSTTPISGQSRGIEELQWRAIAVSIGIPRSAYQWVPRDELCSAWVVGAASAQHRPVADTVPCQLADPVDLLRCSCSRSIA
jgi:hypothetical protein